MFFATKGMDSQSKKESKYLFVLDLDRTLFVAEDDFDSEYDNSDVLSEENYFYSEDCFEVYLQFIHKVAISNIIHTILDTGHELLFLTAGTYKKDLIFPIFKKAWDINHQLLEKTHFANRFDHGGLEVLKGHKIKFFLMSNNLPIPPKNCLLYDDNLVHINNAESMGFQVLQANSLRCHANDAIFELERIVDGVIQGQEIRVNANPWRATNPMPIVVEEESSEDSISEDIFNFDLN